MTATLVAKLASSCCLPVLLVLSIAEARADLAALDRVPVPAGAEREIVALDLLQNGRRVSIATLDVSGSGEDTLAFYREAWADGFADRPGFVEGEAGDWRLISRLEDDENRVVQLRDGEDGVEAIVSVLALEKAATIPDLYTHPAGGETLSTTTSVDDGIGRATTTVVQTRQSEGETVAFYRDTLERAGWSTVTERRDTNASVLFFARRGVRLELVVSAISGGSLAVFNQVEDT